MRRVFTSQNDRTPSFPIIQLLHVLRFTTFFCFLYYRTLVEIVGRVFTSQSDRRIFFFVVRTSLWDVKTRPTISRGRESHLCVILGRVFTTQTDGTQRTTASVRVIDFLDFRRVILRRKVPSHSDNHRSQLTNIAGHLCEIVRRVFTSHSGRPHTLFLVQTKTC